MLIQIHFAYSPTYSLISISLDFAFISPQISIARLTAGLSQPIMFANIFLLSLLTIIYGTKGDEGGGRAVERNTVNFLPDISQQQHSSGAANICSTLCLFFLCIAITFDRFEFHKNAEIDKNAVQEYGNYDGTRLRQARRRGAGIHRK